MNTKHRTDNFKKYISDIEKDKLRTQKENHIIQVYDDVEAQGDFKKGYIEVS